MVKLTLYHFSGCPYCAHVKDYLNKNSISISMKDTQKDPGANEELIKIGGRPQVPCLFIDGKALYESFDIIEWFKTNWKK